MCVCMQKFENVCTYINTRIDSTYIHTLHMHTCTYENMCIDIHIDTPHIHTSMRYTYTYIHPTYLHKHTYLWTLACKLYFKCLTSLFTWPSLLDMYAQRRNQRGRKRPCLPQSCTCVCIKSMIYVGL